MKEYDYAHQMNRPVPLDEVPLHTVVLERTREQVVDLIHRANKGRAKNETPAPKR